MKTNNFIVPPYNTHYEGVYDQCAQQWRRLCAIGKAKNILSLLNAQRPIKILEVGCGTGAVLIELRRQGLGSIHIGMDLADPNSHSDEDTAGIQLSKYDGKILPFEDDSFDLVYATHVIEHVPNPRDLLSEMIRVSRDFIYCEVPCELHLRTTHESLQRTLNIGHINAYTPLSFKLLLESSGLVVQDLRIFDHSLEVHVFDSGKIKGLLKACLRGALLKLSPRLASKVFTYHCGALLSKIKS